MAIRNIVKEGDERLAKRLPSLSKNSTDILKNLFTT